MAISTSEINSVDVCVHETNDKKHLFIDLRFQIRFF